MTSAQSIVGQFLAAIERKDIDDALSFLSEDCVYDNVPIGPVTGHEAVRSILGPLLAGASRVEWEVLRESTTGNVVFNERIDRFDLPHGTVELPVTGVWEVHDEKISLWRDYFDLASFTRQMPAR